MKILPIYLHLLLIIFSGTLFVVGNADMENAEFDNSTVADGIEENEIVGWTPSYQNAKEIAEHGITQKVYYASDGTCGVRDENGNYKPPKMKMFEFGEDDDNEKDCLQNFHHKRFGPMCGDPAYPKIKYCTMVHFFDNNKEPVLKDGKKDMLLALIDGCAVCNANKGSNLQMELSLKWTWPEGSLFTRCKEKTMEAFKMENNKFRIANNKRMFPKFKDYSEKGLRGSFVLPGILYQRICKGFFSADDMLDSFNDIKLVVKHNCGGSKASFEVDLPELITKNYELNIAEMRGLLLDLDAQKALLYNFYGGKKGDPFNDYIETLKWGNWDAFGRIESPKKEAANN